MRYRRCTFIYVVFFFIFRQSIQKTTKVHCTTKPQLYRIFRKVLKKTRKTFKGNFHFEFECDIEVLDTILLFFTNFLCKFNHFIILSLAKLVDDGCVSGLKERIMEQIDDFDGKNLKFKFCLVELLKFEFKAVFMILNL